MEKQIGFNEAQFFIAHAKHTSLEKLSTETGIPADKIEEFCLANSIPLASTDWSETDLINLRSFVHEGLVDVNIMAMYLQKDPDQIREKLEELEYGEVSTGPTGGTLKRYKQGKRKDLGDMFFRSSWEANFARWLNWQMENDANCDIDKWEFEPDKFEFEGVKGRNYSYTPDFKITRKDGSHYYVEVKGYLTNDGRIKLKRMAKFYPDEQVDLFDRRMYGELKREVSSLIPNWE